MGESYSADVCGLCGSNEWSAVGTAAYARGMWSDSRISQRPLRKRLCARCGLVRDGNSFNPDQLATHYGDDYELNAQDEVCEHTFFKDGEAIPRGEAIARWIGESLPASDVPIGSICEVGAGAGALLRRLAAAYPDAIASGVELNATAAAAARRSGLAVADGDDTAITGYHDLIVATFVLEHVPSPVRFLATLASHLAPGGRLVVAQPMQDVESHDLYFVDHLHHFASTHVEWLANRAGLVQTAVSRSPWFAPNASLHVLAHGAECAPPVTFVPQTALARAVSFWEEVFASCRAFAQQARGAYALFGASEFAGLLNCYGDLHTLNLRLVIDDRPQRHPRGVFGVPVKAFDDVTDAEIASLDAVVLALNPVYHDAVTRRCEARGLAVVNPFQPGTLS